MHLSVVIPVYNSATSINQVVGDCFAALSHLDFEIVLVDDGSTDNSEEVIFQLAQQHPNIKAISLAKNVGEFNAVMCGLRFATGKYVAIIDDDGQNPPAEILKLLARAESGYDVVYAQYAQKMHAGWRNAGSWVNNFAASVFIKKPVGLYLSSFKVMSKIFVDEIIEINDKGTYLDGLIFRLKPSCSVVNVEHVKSNIPSRYNVIKLTGTFLSMLDSGGRLWLYFLLSISTAFALLFISVASLVIEPNPARSHILFLFLIQFVIIGNFLFALIMLILPVYFLLKIMKREKILSKAKKSFNA